jgi:hypothetical protein
MIRYAIETTTDENTGLDKFLIVDTVTGNSIDSAYDRVDAEEICDYYNDRESEDVYNDDPGEYQEWMDFDPDC